MVTSYGCYVSVFFLIITLPLNAVALAFVDMSYIQEVQLPPHQKKKPWNIKIQIWVILEFFPFKTNKYENFIEGHVS